MGLTVGDAQAIQDITRYALGIPRDLTGPVSEERAREAWERLLGRAHTTMAAGVTADELAAYWPPPTCRAHGEAVAYCRVCHCTEDRACEGGCSWVPDPFLLGDLCSACCAPEVAGDEDLGRVLLEVGAERRRQDERWGLQDHPSTPGTRNARLFAARMAEEQREVNANVETVTWQSIILEEVFEACAEEDLDRVRAEVLQAAAVAVAWVQALDRRRRHEALAEAGRPAPQRA